MQDFKVDISSEISSESESGTDNTFSASDDGSYTLAINANPFKGNVAALINQYDLLN
jgi:hypothetical protein